MVYRKTARVDTLLTDQDRRRSDLPRGHGQQTAVTPVKILASGCEETSCPTDLPHQSPEHWGKPFLPCCKATATTAGPPSQGRGGWGAQEEPRGPTSPRGWAENGSLRPPQSHQVRREKPGVPLPTNMIEEPVCLLHATVCKDFGIADSLCDGPPATASERKQAHPALFLIFW